MFVWNFEPLKKNTSFKGNIIRLATVCFSLNVTRFYTPNNSEHH